MYHPKYSFVIPNRLRENKFLKELVGDACTCLIVFQKVCKFQFIYFCNRTVKNNLLWNLHLSK